jgi:hypothetical protein
VLNPETAFPANNNPFHSARICSMWRTLESHELCTLYTRACTIIIAWRCFDPARSLINLDPLHATGRPVHQFASLHTKHHTHAFASSTYLESDILCSHFSQCVPCRNVGKFQIKHYIYIHMRSRKLRLTTVGDPLR